jgi:hypothetical protein
MEQAMKKILWLICFQILIVSGLFSQNAITIWAGTPFAISFSNISSINSKAYMQKMKALANGDASGQWPAKIIYPSGESVLPYKRIVAFYGNLFSKNMGILGQLPKEEMLKKLAMECALWEKADVAIPVMPALHYIAATAQASPGNDGMYRFRMPATEIEKVISWAREINGITFLDIQTGHSTVKAEVAVLEKYLKMPDVHLGIDPEYAMKNGGVPGSSIGTFDADEINDAIDILVKIVQENQLTPKILIVHRFTYGMVTHYKKIKLVPEVQIVIHMDGFGSKVLKLDTYKAIVAREPVQFAGFKLFYKIDKPVMYTPEELMKLKPIPVYIQYQ